MQKTIVSLLAIVMCSVVGSCKLPSSKDQVDKPKRHHSKPANDRVADILEYKIKEEHYRKDSLDLTFKKIILEKIAPFEYELTIDIETDPSKIQFRKEYYIIMAIYPEDDKTGLLAPDRKKYGFESFSAKIVKNKNDELFIKRKVRTKIEFARAITLTVMEYKNNRKSRTIIMQNVII